MKTATNKYLDARLGLVLGVEPGEDNGFMGRVAAGISDVKDWWGQPGETELEEGLRNARKGAAGSVGLALDLARAALKEIVESFALESELDAVEVQVNVGESVCEGVREGHIEVNGIPGITGGPTPEFCVSLRPDGWEVRGVPDRRFEALGEAWVAACAGYYGPRPSVVNGAANLLLDGLPTTG
jgi:hypothetical protein